MQAYKHECWNSEWTAEAASQIRQRICAEANDAYCFISDMVDESKDLSRKEQMSFCIRYVAGLDFEIHEEFLYL